MFWTASVEVDVLLFFTVVVAAADNVIVVLGAQCVAMCVILINAFIVMGLIIIEAKIIVAVLVLVVYFTVVCFVTVVVLVVVVYGGCGRVFSYCSLYRLVLSFSYHKHIGGLLLLTPRAKKGGIIFSFG